MSETTDLYTLTSREVLSEFEAFWQSLEATLLEIMLSVTDPSPLAQIPLEFLIVYAIVAAAASGFVFGFVLALDFTTPRPVSRSGTFATDEPSIDTTEE